MQEDRCYRYQDQKRLEFSGNQLERIIQRLRKRFRIGKERLNRKVIINYSIQIEDQSLTVKVHKPQIKFC